MKKLFNSSIYHRKTLHISAIFLTAIILRFFYLSEIIHSPFYESPVVDGRTYISLSKQLASGNWLGETIGPFWQPPLYPYVLAIVRILDEDSFFNAVRWLQCILSSLTCVGIYLLACKWYDSKVGLLAAGTACIYGPMIFFDGEILPASLAMSISMAGFLVYELAQNNNRKIYLFISGLLFGFASITVATILVGILTLFVWTIYQKRNLLYGLLFISGAILVIGLVTWRNYEVGNDNVLISSNSGVNFFIGNNKKYDETINIRPGWQWDKLVSQPRALGIELPSEKSAFFWKSSFDFIKNHPSEYVLLQLKKTWGLFHGYEQGRNQDIYFWRNYSDLLSVLLWHYGLAFPFGLISPLALIGLARYFRQLNNFGGLYVFTYALAIIMFFPTARYRIVIIPLLLIFFAHTFFWLKDSMQNRSYRDYLFRLFWIVLIFLFFNFGGQPMNMKGDAEIHFNLGQAYADKKRPEKALSHLQKAVQIDSTHWQALFNLGSIEGMKGNLDAAKNIFLKVTQAEPNRPEVWVNLAHAQRGLGQNESATFSYEQTLRINPYLPKIYLELLQLYTQLGQNEKAKKVLNRAITIYPKDRKKILTLFSNLKRRF